MIGIIETNLSMKNGKVFDHQSRVVEAESWDEYINYYANNIKPDRQHSNFRSVTNLFGDSLPRYGDMTEFNYDDYHLSCYITNFNGTVTMKLAYLCKENNS